MDDAAANVVPLRSLTNCTWVWRDARLTPSRGRSDVPDTFLRSRAWRRSRAVRRAAEALWPAGLCCEFSRLLAILLARLSDLAANLLTLAAHALALVRVRT